MRVTTAWLGAVLTLGAIGCGGSSGGGDDGAVPSWAVTTVDANPAVRSIAVALDGSGQPHVAWVDQGTGKVSYASRSGGTWSTVDVTGVTTGDEGMALAIDGSGHPHLAFQVDNGVSAGGVRHAFHDGTGWTVETVESSVVGARSPSISMALTGAGEPVIAYYSGDGVGQGLRVATRTGANAFSVTTPDATAYAGFGGTSVAVDSLGKPSVAYTVYSYTPWGGASGLSWVKFDGSWGTPETADATFGAGFGASLALDGSGRPRIAYQYFDGVNVNDIRYAVRGTSGWTWERVGSGSVGPALALETDGTPWIAFGVAPGSWIKVGSRDAAWTLEQLPATSADWMVDLAVSGTGVPHVAFDNGSTADAMYATRN